MRDYAVFAVTAIGLLFTLRKPWIGVLLYAWFAYMNPHRLCYYRAYYFPFTMVIVSVLLISLLISRERKWPPLTRESVLLVAFSCWMTLSTLTALNADAAWGQWNQVMKIMFMVLVIMTMMTTRLRLNSFVWVIVLSLGYYAARGAFSTIRTGGNNRVYGPDFSFIADNNDLALAIVTVVPLIMYLVAITPRRWVRFGLLALVCCSVVAVIGTYSRAGMLALLCVSLMLCWKSKHRIRTTAAVVVLLGLVYAYAPSAWFDRMQTVGTYEQDNSAMGRINAWHFAVNLAADRPINGGGFEAFTPALFERYAPDPGNFHAAHSIYFKVLGEHGYVGLFLFLALGISTWWTARRVRKEARSIEGAEWAYHLVGMAQVALAGYAVGGAFGNLCYFDLPYHLMAIISGCGIAVRRMAAQAAAATPELEDSPAETLLQPESMSVLTT